MENLASVINEFDSHNFMGKNGFVWWYGVVEDRKDPLYLGRVRVRCIGWHTDDKDLIATEDLRGQMWFSLRPLCLALVNR